MMNERVNDWDMFVGRALWVYNMSMQKSIGMSPCKYILNFERFIKPRMKLSENDRELWRRANEKFESFKVGEKVLKEVIEKGRLNVNKMTEKFEGPYIVKKVWSNGLSYLLEYLDESGCVNEMRAHHNQLRKWREPPEYLKIHAMNEWLKKNRIIEEEDNELWKDKQLVLIEEKPRNRRRKKDRKRISGHKDKSKIVSEVNQENRATFSICQFALNSKGVESNEIELVDIARRVGREESAKIEVENVVIENEGAEVEFLKEIDTILSSDGFSGYNSEEIARYRDRPRPNVNELGVREDMLESMKVLGDSREISQRSNNVYQGPVTRQRGQVPEYDWVMK